VSSVFAKRTKPRWSKGTYTVSRIEQLAFYFLAIKPDGEGEDDGVDNDTRFHKYQLELIDRPPQTKPAPGPNMEEKYDGDHDGPLVLGNGSAVDSLEEKEDQIDLQEELRRRRSERRLGREGLR
jgi:hypothetical protein